jgi:hypothetical protein
LDKLTGKDKTFYYTIIVPTLNKCADPHFGSDFDEILTDEKETLCATVEEMKELFVELNYTTDEDGFLQRTRENVRVDLRNVVHDNLQHLKGKYSALLSNQLANKMREYVKQIAETKNWNLHVAKKLLDTAFIQAFDQLIDLLSNHLGWAKKMREYLQQIAEIKKRNLHVAKKRLDMDTAFTQAFDQLIELAYTGGGDRDTTDMRRKVAYKLLLIGHEMRKVFTKDSVELAEWTYQQFAANLAIYSLQLDTKKSHGAKGTLQGIAESWQMKMGMTILEEGTVESWGAA